VVGETVTGAVTSKTIRMGYAQSCDRRLKHINGLTAKEWYPSREQWVAE